MPKEITDLKLFLQHLKQSQDSNAQTKSTRKGKEDKETNRPKNSFKKQLRVKKSGKITKFKLRTSRYLYTFKTSKPVLIKKITSSVPSNIQQIDVDKKNKKK